MKKKNIHLDINTINTMTLELKNTFLTKCIPVRGLIAAAVYATPDEYMPYWAVPAGIVAAGTAYQYFNHDENQLGVFNQKVKWNSMRPVHIIMIIIFIVLIANHKYEYAKYLPVLDIVIGILFMLSKYSNDYPTATK
jgi:hypothetical protein